MSERVGVEVADEIAYVTLTRADKYNGLDFPMLRALISAARQVASDRAIRVVILQGAGRGFCAGLDFASVGKDPKAMIRGFAKLPVQTTNLFQRACWVWRELPVPVIAVVHGKCYGGGFQLALAADFRMSTPDCEYSMMEATWGLIPDMSGSVTLRELVGMDIAKRLAMTGELFDGVRAREYGLVTEVSADPLADAHTLAAALIAGSPDAVAATKALLQQSWHRSPRAALWLESRLQLRLLFGANHKIARAANAAKQVPAYVRRGSR